MPSSALRALTVATAKRATPARPYAADLAMGRVAWKTMPKYLKLKHRFNHPPAIGELRLRRLVQRCRAAAGEQHDLSFVDVDRQAVLKAVGLKLPQLRLQAAG